MDVVLLCGGKGERMRPHTLETPKPLLLINNKPFLYYLIKKFLKIKVNQIILAAGYKFHKIKKFKLKYFNKNKNIKLFNSGNVDIIKRLQDCSKFIKDDFIVCYGDTHVSIDLNKYIKNFYASEKDSSVLSTYFKLKYGTIIYNKKTLIVKNFLEKPIIQNPINLGYFIFKKKLIKEICKSKSWAIFLDKISKKNKMLIQLTNKKFFSFDTPRDYFDIKSKFMR